MTTYGYARVSTGEQCLDGQIAELKAAGCTRIFQEKISGAKADRKQLAALMKVLAEGDVVMVTRLDRLARSTRDLLNTVDTITKLGGAFRSIKDSWCDTTSAHGRLMMTILAGLAEFERELIVARTGEGRVRAVAKGVKFGRRPKLSAYQRKEAISRREAGETLMSIARSYGVDHSMISRL
jgi:DNA invertase Pin-like site-specific DNA recombinase